MSMLVLKSWLKDFRKDESGTVTVEAVLTLPLLFFALAATYEFFEVHRYASARDKASYTIADMVSREMQSVNDTYMTNAKTVFDAITNDGGADQLRISIIKYDEDEDVYSVKWSKVRGDGAWDGLQTSDVTNDRAHLPMMNDGEELIVVESASHYPPLFDVGITRDKPVNTRIFTSPRFAPQIVWENS